MFCVMPPTASLVSKKFATWHGVVPQHTFTIRTQDFVHLTDIGGGLGETQVVQGLGSLYHTIGATGPAGLVTYIGNFLSVQVRSTLYGIFQ